MHKILQKPSPRVPTKSAAANLYNPHEQSKEQLVERFVVRQAALRELYQAIKTSNMSGPERPYLIEGQRGTGKTTLLLRLSYEIEEDPRLQPWLIPIVLKEEAYYGIRRLYTLWKRIAQKLAFKDSKYSGLVKQMELAYEREYHPIFHERNYERTCFQMLYDALEEHSQKIVLFIDNFGELLYNFSGQELYRLYRILKECPVLRLVAASSIALEGLVSDEDRFFYDMFRKIRLQGLNKDETYAILFELARTSGKEALMTRLVEQHPGRIESLRILTGGVIRTIILLFEIFIEREAGTTLSDLEAILDTVTPLYKHRMDILSPLQRDVINAIALNWEAVSLEDISKTTLLHPDQIAAILQDLEHVFLIERIGSVPKRQLYRLQERFFNIWYLMRLSLGNGQARITWLLRFLESWYDQAGLTQLARKHTKAVSTGRCQPDSAFYLTEAFVKIGSLDQQLEHQMVFATQKLLHATNARLASESSPSDRELFCKGETYYQQKRYAKAISYFLKLKQKNDQVYFRIGYAFNKLSRYNQAIPYYLKAAKLGHVEAMLHLGMVYDYHIHNQAKALHYYTEASDRGHTDAMLNLGNLYYYRFQDYPNAKKYYLLAVKAGQERSKILSSENFSLKYLKNYLVTVVKGHTKNPEAYDIHDFPEAQHDYVQAMKYTASEAMFQLGNLYSQQLREPEKAEKFYKMAAQSGHVRAMVLLGDLYYYTQKDYKQAERFYYMAAKTHDPDGLFNLGFLYHNILKQYKKAERCYQVAAEKGQVNAMNALAWLYFEQKQEKQKSLHYIRRTLKIEHTMHTAHTAACIYLWNDLSEEAFEIAEQFMNSSEAYETLEKDILFYLMLLLAKHHYHKALTYFRSSVMDLQERFKPVYYAMLYFIGAPDYQKLPPELTEPVRDIVRQVRTMTLEYA